VASVSTVVAGPSAGQAKPGPSSFLTPPNGRRTQAQKTDYPCALERWWRRGQTARVCVRLKSDHCSLFSHGLRCLRRSFFGWGRSHRPIPSWQALMPCSTQGNQTFGGRRSYRSSTCLLLFLFSRAAAATLSAPSSSAAASSTRVVDTIVGRIRKSMDAGAGSCLESHVCCSFGLGKSKGSCKGCRVPFKHEFADLLVDELGNKLLDQGEVVVDLLTRVRTVVEVAETNMPSSDVFRRNLFCDVVLGVGVHASGGRHELLLVLCYEVLPGGYLDGRVGGQVGNVDRDDVGRVSGCFFSHCRSGLPDPMDVGPSIDFTHFQIVRFPRPSIPPSQWS
jgi:hypothetical protein